MTKILLFVGLAVFLAGCGNVYLPQESASAGGPVLQSFDSLLPGTSGSDDGVSSANPSNDAANNAQAQSGTSAEAASSATVFSIPDPILGPQFSIPHLTGQLMIKNDRWAPYSQFYLGGDALKSWARPPALPAIPRPASNLVVSGFEGDKLGFISKTRLSAADSAIHDGAQRVLVNQSPSYFAVGGQNICGEGEVMTGIGVVWLFLTRWEIVHYASCSKLLPGIERYAERVATFPFDRGWSYTDGLYACEPDEVVYGSVNVFSQRPGLSRSYEVYCAKIRRATP